MSRESEVATPISQQRPWRHYGLLALVVLIAGLLPYRALLHHFPWGTDAQKWVSQGALDSSDWVSWVFASRHFIGYRPVTALSFVVDNAITGFAPFGYRVTDIALHVATGVLVFAVWRALVGRRSAWAVAATAFLFVHPVVEHLVPYVARRSYSLATSLGLAALLLFVWACRGSTRLDGDGSGSARVTRNCLIGSTAFLAAAMLSNEVAYIMVPVFAMVALHLRKPGESWLRPALLVVPAGATTLALLALRLRLLGVLGGYHKHYFSFVANNRPHLKEVKDPSAVDIFNAAWSYICFPSSFKGFDGVLLTSTIGIGCAAVVLGYYAWRSVLRPLIRLRYPDERLPLLLLLWLLGLSLLFAFTGTWFWRQAYPMLVPMAMLVALIARNTVREYRGWRLAAHLVPQLLLVFSTLYHSPVFRDLEEDPIEKRRFGTRLLQEIRRDFEMMDDGSVVYLVLPARPPTAHMVRIWLGRLIEPREVTFKVLASLKERQKNDDLDHPWVEVEYKDDGRLRLQLSDRLEWSGPQIRKFKLRPTMGLWFHKLHDADRPTYLYFFEGETGRLLPTPPPPDDSADDGG